MAQASALPPGVPCPRKSDHFVALWIDSSGKPARTLGAGASSLGVQILARAEARRLGLSGGQVSVRRVREVFGAAVRER